MPGASPTTDLLIDNRSERRLVSFDCLVNVCKRLNILFRQRVNGPSLLCVNLEIKQKWNVMECPDLVELP